MSGTGNTGGMPRHVPYRTHPCIFEVYYIDGRGAVFYSHFTLCVMGHNGGVVCVNVDKSKVWNLE